MTDLDHFRHCAHDNKLRAWLVQERETAVKFMVKSVDPVALHRAQGMVSLLDNMLALQEKARDL